MREYDQIAAWYAATRDPAVGAADLAAFAQTLSAGARVLDLGCGHGIPVSRLLVDEGCEVVALDSSAALVARYRARFPDVPVQCARAQDVRYPAASFDGVVAWGVLFHLSASDQAAVLEKVGAWLRPNGRLLFTSAAEAGVRHGSMQGVPFRYLSLGVRGYREAAERAGLTLCSHHADAWENHLYVMEKPGQIGGA